MEHKGFVIWFTGLPCSGKSTLALRVGECLKNNGYKVEILDGDEVRTHLSRGLGFSKEDRDINIRRIGFVAKILARNGVIAITAAISPYTEIRAEQRKAISNFVEVFVECPLDVLKERDVKGMYKKALAGEIKHFTGVDDPYEPPVNPEVWIHSDKESVEISTKRIIDKLVNLKFIDQALKHDADGYTNDKCKPAEKRSGDPGYIIK